MNQPSNRVLSGLPGLDEVLNGGFIAKRGYLIRGGPGTGKTTLGMRFLSEGIRNNEPVLYISLGESEKDLKQNAESIGIETAKMNFVDLSPESDFFVGEKDYDLFTTAEVERDPISKKIVETVRRLKPNRVFLDSTAHLRYLSIDSFQFRKQLLSFIRFLLEESGIVLYTSEGTVQMPDDDVMYISDGVISLSLLENARYTEVTKFRGSDFRTGCHTFRLTDEGPKVYPRLVPGEHSRGFSPELIRSGIPEIDTLFGGGLEKGTITIVSGPAGVGKTTLAIQFAREAAKNRSRTVMLSFEESEESICYRARSIGTPLEEMIESGFLKIISIEPLLFTADEIAAIVRHEVESESVQAVILDGVSGYELSVAGNVQTHLRSLFKYLTNMSVSVIAINEIESITGDFKITEIGISYMADNIVFIRYLELHGEMRKAIGVLKKRLGDFERALREFSITARGLVVGAPLNNLRGILNGVPEWVSETKA